MSSVTVSVCSEETIAKIMDYIERYVMTRLYRSVFCSALTDDEENDLIVQEKIRSLRWINAYTLDAKIDESIEAVRTLVDQAITGENPERPGHHR